MKTCPIALASAVALALSLGGISALPAQPAGGQGAATSEQAGLEQAGVEQAGGLQDWLAGRRVEDVVGTDVYNRTGERIGEVEEVVRDSSDGSLHAIVSVGGFLGIGDTEISFPLLGMGMQDGNLIAPVDVGADRLKDRPGYEEGRFTPMQSAETLLIEEAPPATGAASAQQEPIPRKTLQTGMEDSGVELGGVEPDRRVEGALAEPGQIKNGTDFAELDQDGNQHIDRKEAQAAPGLIENWQQADRDGDGRIDRAEFSAFEDQLRPGEGKPRAGRPAGETSGETPTAD
jgi:hypothetical protein